MENESNWESFAKEIGKPVMTSYLNSEILMQDYIELAARLEGIDKDVVKKRISNRIPEAKIKLENLIKEMYKKNDDDNKPLDIEGLF